ncbi:hypothetical protein PROFUN_13846 [Planoprotostelium fungivorum]|uniref:Uncharacterized protein n=1 Tax=Planoprotostelium fungivorum TaxID=1890364 RepID=A0A2P6N2Q6_9EUKA|nr:hypothetical protein PROFUN_13846 [Planoprotostelium fungivorum]
MSLCGRYSFGFLHDGSLSLCFAGSVLWPISSVTLFAYAIYRSVNMRSSIQQQIPLNSSQVIKLGTCVILSALYLVLSAAELMEGERLWIYKFIQNGCASLAWMICTYTIYQEYNRSQKHSLFLKLWILSNFLLTGFITISLWYQREEERIEMLFSIATLINSTVLTVIYVFINGAPPGYDRLPSSSEEDDTDFLISDMSKKDMFGQASIVSKLLFLWMQPLLRVGSRRALELDHLYSLPRELQTMEASRRMEEEWMDETKREKPSLWRALYRSTGGQLLKANLCKLIEVCSQFAGPILLRQIVLFVQEYDPSQEEQRVPTYHGLIYVLLLSFFMVLQSAAAIQHWHMAVCVGIKARTSLISLVYKKSFRISSKSKSNSSTGEMVNLQAMDAHKFQELAPNLSIIWSAPIIIIVSIVLLYQQIGISSVAGIVVMFILVPINAKISIVVRNLQRQVMKLRDKRIEKMNEIVNGIRIIKLFAWEESFQQQVDGVREEELVIKKKNIIIRGLQRFLFIGSPIWIALASFSLYTLLGNQLTSDKAFTAIALFNLMRMPTTMLPTIVTSLLEAMVSADRIVKFLTSEENDPTDVRDIPRDDSASVRIDRASWSWDSKSTCPTLNDITLEIPKGKLVAVVGSVGSGKSTFLSALLGDVPKVSGTLLMTPLKAYAAQNAWIQNASVRENILFGQTYDKERYDTVCRVCELVADIRMLPEGDLTEIGEKGINLSGGQKQRISLARAVYQERDIYLLDDPLSAVDAHVGRSIFNNCIDGLLSNKTRILVTHQLQFLDRADIILVLKEGKISEQGSFQDLMETKGEFYQLITSHVKSSEGEEKGTSNSHNIRASGERKDNDGGKKGKLMTDEARGVGKISTRTWVMYISAVGLPLVAVSALSVQLMESATRLVNDFWISHWTESVLNENRRSDVYYLVIYAVTGLLVGLMLFLRGIIIAYYGLRAARNLHNKIVDTVSFFDTTPTGRILNVFSRDVNALDDILPMSIEWGTGSFFNAASSIFVICVVLPSFLILLLPFELKRLDSLSKSPIYAQFSGFIEKNYKKIDINNAANFSFEAAARWLALRLDLIGMSVVSISSAFAVLQRANLSPGSVGLMITYGLTLTQMLGFLVRLTTDIEAQMVSVERVDGYTKNKQEAPADVSGDAPSDWPTTGRVVFKDVKMRYREGLELVLKGVNVSIQSGEKVGVVGRTGAGKSSLMLALFRICELAAGTITIDGKDISSIGLDRLRRCLSIIPQDATLFTGTVRSNLDPFSQYEDRDLWRALESVQLKGFVEGLRDKLEEKITEGGENLSVGTRQLVCLARAILRHSRVLVMDEATAAVDFETDSLIQQTVRSQFKGATVLTIAHRLQTIMDYDKIIVLDKGVVAEFDSPQELLKIPNGIFREMVSTSGTVPSK